MIRSLEIIGRRGAIHAFFYLSHTLPTYFISPLAGDDDQFVLRECVSGLWVRVPDVHQHVERLTSDQELENHWEKGGNPFVCLLSCLSFSTYFISPMAGDEEKFVLRELREWMSDL